jgi:hypothetical protein
MPIRRLLILMVLMAAVLVGCGGAPAAPTTVPMPTLSAAAAPFATVSAAPTASSAAQATAQTSAPLAQDNLADANALRLAAAEQWRNEFFQSRDIKEREESTPEWVMSGSNEYYTIEQE